MSPALRGRPARRSLTHHLRSWSAALAVALLAVPASADAAPSLSVTAGNDPVESITTQLGLSGNAESSSNGLTVKVRPTGGAPCAANPGADEGETVLTETVGTGPFDKSRNWTFDDAGSYLVCGWMRDYTQTGNPVVANATKEVVVRVPRLSLTLSVPGTVNLHEAFQLSATVQAEAPWALAIYAVPDTGRGCPANGSAARSAPGDDWPEGGVTINGGPFVRTYNETLSTEGAHLLCAYFHYRTQSSPPQATAVASFNVVRPCTVPDVLSGSTLAVAGAKLAEAGCTAGAVRRVASARVRRGRLVRFEPGKGRVLPPAAAVTMLVSDGPRCVVPRVRAGTSLGATKRKLAAANCTSGTRSRVRSGVRRGAVVRLRPRAGTRLAPRARVAIVVSRGRGGS